MVNKTIKIRSRRGVTLVGTMVAVAILLIALIGTSTFRYAAAMDGRRADAHTTAARVALTLAESWRGTKGDQTYNPVAYAGSGLNIAADKGPEKPVDFTLLGNYKVQFKDETGVNNYFATLSWKDIQSGLRALNVVVAWSSRNEIADSDKTIDKTDKSFGLTVYTQTY